MEDHDQEEFCNKALLIFREYLKKNSLSVTQTREKVVRTIYELDGHFTVDELEEKLVEFEGSKRATIYRTIKHMMEAGLLAKVQTSSHAKVAYEHTLGHAHHDHLVCDRCGDIIEFQDAAIDVIQRQVAERYGFQILHHSMVLTGVCSSCQKTPKKRSPSNVIITV